MSDDMVERVAKALYESRARSGDVWETESRTHREYCQREARAAIEAMREAFGITAAEFEAMSMEQKAQLAYDRGLEFAAHGTAARGHDGKPVTEQDTKVLRPDFGKPNGEWHE